MDVPQNVTCVAADASADALTYMNHLTLPSRQLYCKSVNWNCVADGSGLSDLGRKMLHMHLLTHT